MNGGQGHVTCMVGVHDGGEGVSGCVDGNGTGCLLDVVVGLGRDGGGFGVDGWYGWCH